MNETDKLSKVRSEYEEGRSYLEPRKQRWVSQLTMMNNMQRGDQNIASTTLYTYFNRVFSSLYSNTMSQKFVPGNDAEIHATQDLNTLAKSDAQEMDKANLDYDWLWDACFYGRGYLEVMKWSKERMLLKPEVINPMFLSYDPFFSEPKQWRYYSKWVLRNDYEMQRLIDMGVVTGISSPDEMTSGVDPYIWTWRIQAEMAKMVNPPTTDTIVPTSGIRQVLEHYTYIGNKKHVVWTDRSVSMILRDEELDFKDDPDDKDGCFWPIVTKVVFKEPHSSATVSVPDLIEDKHRALNVLFNLAYMSAKDEVNPIYLYDTTKVQNSTQFFQRQINQHIPVTDLNNAVAPMKKNVALSNSSLAFINTMKSEASDVIGTAMPAALGQKQKKSATQDAMLQQLSDLAQSLQSKLIAQGESEFWSRWYHRYLLHAEKGDMKIAAITDAMGTTFTSINLDGIKTKYPPKVIIMASKEAEYKEMVERRELAQQLQLIQGILSPSQFKTFLKQYYFPKFKTFDNSSIDVVLPKSSAEIQAENENEALSDGKWVEVKMTDDHETHLAIHSRVKKNAYSWTHILTHQKALAMQADQQKQQAAQQAQQPQQGQQPAEQKPDEGKGAASKPKNNSPLAAAIPSAGVKSPLQPQPLPSNV